MERLLINQDNLNLINTNNSVLLDLINLNNRKIIINKDVNILITKIECNTNVAFELDQNVNVTLSILAKENLDKLNLVFNLKSNAFLNVYFADFSFGKEKAKIEINLNEENASAYWHLASLTSKEDDKEFEVSIYHNKCSTYAVSDNYGVCKDTARLIFSGVSYILNGCHKSKTRQNAKIMEFDPLSKAIAKPILRIDEHDIEASHGAVVGKINDDHLFYLTSRGLTESEAKKLITYGYLKPIMNGFSDEQIKEEISNLIEGRM